MLGQFENRGPRRQWAISRSAEIQDASVSVPAVWYYGANLGKASRSLSRGKNGDIGIRAAAAGS